jgi:hypothetical protein
VRGAAQAHSGDRIGAANDLIPSPSSFRRRKSQHPHAGRDLTTYAFFWQPEPATVK